MLNITNKSKILSRLVSQRRDSENPIFNWFTYKHSFSEDLVKFLIAEFNLKENSYVLDPFCGGGTTLLACKKLNINSVGYDILPFSVFLSRTKTDKYKFDLVEKEYNKFIKRKSKKIALQNFPDIPIVKKAFSSKVYNELFSIKHEISQIKNKKVRNLFSLALLNILEKVSNTSKSGGFLRIVKKRTLTKNIRKLFLNKVETYISDIKTSQINNRDVIAKSYLGDARNIKSKLLFDAVITSPPYPNRHDYTRVYSLELLFGFIKDNDRLKELRYKTLRSHVEAKKFYNNISFNLPPRLKKLIIKIKKSQLNNPQIISMLEGYFEDMYLSLLSLKSMLKKNGKIALVVSNVRFSGIYIPVDEILFEIGESIGLTPKAIWTIRFRGNSAQQMKEYARKPSRESIIIWNK